MRTLFFILSFFICMTGFSEKTFLSSSGKLKPKVSFRENKGQVADQNGRARTDIFFSGCSGGMSFHLSKTGIYYQLLKREDSDRPTPLKRKLSRKEESGRIENTILYRLEVQWPGVNPHVHIEKGKELPGYDNFYLASCPDGALNVKSYHSILYKELYKGIDLKYYEKDGFLKYDYIVSAGADYRQIKLSVKGATSIEVNAKGALVIKTPLGNLEEDAPLVIQEGKKNLAKWVVEGSTVFFELEGLDRQKSYTIDPMVRMWGTYYGGEWEDYSYACITDPLDNVYLIGGTNSDLNIVSTGTHQTVHGGGLADAFLAKFTKDGVRLWGTFCGGTTLEEAYNGCLDLSGNIYIAGYSRSSTGIATAGSHQPVFGGHEDAFLVKFNSGGQRLWGTYYGGTEQDMGKDCMVDAADNVYLVGHVSSTTQIATSGTWQPSLNGIGDAFLVKFSDTGIRIWGTYFGGESGEEAMSITRGAGGSLYIAGNTSSLSGIATAGSAQISHGGNDDGFLAKFNVNGVLQWATYLGGADYEYVGVCEADIAGNVYFSGATSSSSDISTSGSWKPTLSGSGDAFLAKYNDLGVLQWCTYYGGEGFEEILGATIDIMGYVYISGTTTSLTDIATPDGWQNTFGGATFDGFLAQFDPDGILQCATYYGGLDEDFGGGCTSDQTGAIYLNGSTFTSGGIAIATSDSWQPELCEMYPDRADAFLVKFNVFSLPVELLDLKGQCNQGVAEIVWSTTQENENEYFLLQKSTDGIYFSTYDTIVSKGNSTNVKSYSKTYTEAFLYPYVRLLQKDLNGKEKQTGPIIKVEDCGFQLFKAAVFPNPSHHFFTLNLNQLPDSSSMKLVNCLGQTVLEQKLNSLETTFTIPFSNGLYFLKIYQEGEILQVLKLIKD